MGAPGRLPLFLSLLLLSPSLWAATSLDPLWTQAVGFAGASKEWAPGNASFLLEVIDDKGKAQESWHIWYRIGPAAAGGVAMDVVRATHNGADSTQREQEVQKKRKATPLAFGDSPFDPLLQQWVIEQPRGETSTIDGRRCTLYDFSLKKKDGSLLKGTAWLDAGTGAPVEASYSATPLPLGVFKMTTVLRFAAGPAGEGFLREAFIEGVAGVLFIRRNFRTEISVDGYWRRETP